MNGRPKVYMGRDGLKGVSRIGQASYLEKMAGPKKKPTVYMGSGGVSVRQVLANGGIVGGGMVRVRPVTAAKSLYVGGNGAAKVEKPREAEVRKSKMEMSREANRAAAVNRNPPKAVEAVGVYAPAKVEVKAKEVSSPKEGINEGIVDCWPPMDERGNGTKPEVGMTETEERLADFLGAAQEVVLPMGDGKADPPAETEESIAARVKANEAKETMGILPELPFGEMKAEGGKKRRRRRGRKAKSSTEVTEAERTAIQAELEAASDAAAN
jgi:hypothetical protein